MGSSDNAGKPRSVTVIVALFHDFQNHKILFGPNNYHCNRILTLTDRAGTELIAGESHLFLRRQKGLTPCRQIIKCLRTGSPSSSFKPRELSVSGIGIGIGGQLGVTIVILNEAVWPYFMNVKEDRPIDSAIN